MKLRFLFMMLLITVAALSASAQQQESVMTRSQFFSFEKKKIVPVKSLRLTDTLSHKHLLRTNIRKEWYYEGVPVDSSSVEIVYRMPVDKMLCLVPDCTKSANMPVKKTRLPEQMPNAFSRRGR
ncbi:hypothetical protein FAM09_23365 [Niastella caeni]|uniref:Uncharacterized protein n=1 Tax=Niastella caeni TaxID=2569763 RepID=A0A4S8HIQ1_9BACT|nr:hypothetical protein [Niastella caeni]THU34933.1 hypothetical protein FAM09_23365 [Niastella caeni]